MAMSIDNPGMTENHRGDADAIDTRAKAVDQPQSPDRDTGGGKREPAETRTREEYADAMRSGRGNVAGHPDSSLGGSMAETAPGAALGDRVRGTESEQAEMSRGEYASKMRQPEPGTAGAAEKRDENPLPGTGAGQARDLTVMAGLHPALQQEAHPAIQERAPPDASAPGDAVGSLAVTAVAAAESIRYLIHRWKGHKRD
jgi:hypothetical protein